MDLVSSPSPVRRYLSDRRRLGALHLHQRSPQHLWTARQSWCPSAATPEKARREHVHGTRGRQALPSHSISCRRLSCRSREATCSSQSLASGSHCHPSRCARGYLKRNASRLLGYVLSTADTLCRGCSSTPLLLTRGTACLEVRGCSGGRCTTCCCDEDRPAMGCWLMNGREEDSLCLSL